MIDILVRAKQLILFPKDTWAIIKSESMKPQEIIVNYAAPLALIPAVAHMIALLAFGVFLPSGKIIRPPLLEAVTGGVIIYLFQLAGLLAVAWAAQWLAQYFNSKTDFVGSLKLIVYSMTPAWILGVFAVLPMLSVLQIFGIYGVYLLCLGFPIILDTPADRAVWYTILTAIAFIVINAVITVIVSGAVYGPMIMRMMAG